MSVDKVGVHIFKVFYFIGKFLGIFAFDYDFRKKLFLTSVPATVMSSVICIFVAIVSPVVLKWNSDIYFVSGVDIDDNMSIITATQFGIDLMTSFVVLLCQLWKREHVVQSANDFRKVFRQLTIQLDCGKIITLEIILLFAMKLSITMYEALINFPYLIEYGDNISPERFVAFFLKLYIGMMAAVFYDMTFVALLLLARYFYLVDEALESLKMEVQAGGTTRMEIHKCRRKLVWLIRLHLRLRQMVYEFADNVQTSILLYILNSFSNMLSNLYVLLEFFTRERTFQMMPSVYNVMIFCNIYLVIHAAERVKRNSADLRDTLLDLDASRGRHGSEWRSDVLAFKIWPEGSEISILGLFPLDNTFVLFLISYASNFVVIILQFQLTKLL